MKLPEIARAARVGSALLVLGLGLVLAPERASAQASLPPPSPPPASKNAPTAAPSPGPAAATPVTNYAALASELAALPASQEFGRRLEASAGLLPPVEAARLLSAFATKALGPEAQRSAFRRSGELYLLLGLFLEAGRNLEAAGLLGPRDELLLLQAARAYLAAGEGSRAGELAALVLSSSGGGQIGAKARLAAAWAALLGGSPASARALASTLIPSAEAASTLIPGAEAASSALPKGEGAASRDPEAAAIAREARFLLWAASSGEERKTQALLLASEQPGSPEALIAESKPGIGLPHLPHWYLGGLIGKAPDSRPPPSSPLAGGGAKPSAPAAPAAAAAAPAQSSAAVAAQAQSPAAAAAAAQAQTPPAASGTAQEASEPRLFQLGIFSRRENAEALLAELGKKGFRARIEARKVSGKDLLAVVVEAGKEPAAVGARLKDSGYEAYPLF